MAGKLMTNLLGRGCLLNGETQRHADQINKTYEPDYVHPPANGIRFMVDHLGNRRAGEIVAVYREEGVLMLTLKVKFNGALIEVRSDQLEVI